jgi:hypothetical protein
MSLLKIPSTKEERRLKRESVIWLPANKEWLRVQEQKLSPRFCVVVAN